MLFDHCDLPEPVLQILTKQYERFESKLKEIDEKLANNFDTTNEKTMLEVNNIFNFILSTIQIVLILILMQFTI